MPVISIGRGLMKKLLLLSIALVAGIANGPSNAADLPTHMSMKAPAMAPLYSWTGCYIGANAGGGSDQENFTDINLGADAISHPSFDLGSAHATGAMGGGQIGCDYQAGNWVVGAQGMFDATDFKGSNHVVPGPGDPQFGDVYDLSSRVSWVATATARIGYAIQPQLLLYARGGAAWMRSDLNFSVTAMGLTNTYTGAETRTGWTAGAGLEYLVAANWSVFAEYSHMDFGASTLNTTLITDPSPVPIRIGHRIDSVMLGLNYRVGSAPR
jgi:outer membrane immunogenic protein